MGYAWPLARPDFGPANDSARDRPTDHQDAATAVTAMPVARSIVLLLGLAALYCVEPSAAHARSGLDTGAPTVDVDTAHETVVPASLDVAADSTGRLRAPELLVRGQRIDAQRRADRAAGFATVFEASSWLGRAQSASEVLSRAVGITVRDSGGFGGYSSVSIRGSSSAQVPVFLDGVLLNGPVNGSVDLADIELSQLDRIEVYRGSAPLVLGGASMGGAIHLFSGVGHRPWRGSISRSSYEAWAGEFAGGARRGNWSLRLRGRAARSDNDWSYLDDNQTLYNPDDDARRPRLNNDAQGLGAQLSATRPWANGSFTVSELLDQREQGVPGFGSVRSETARSRSTTHQLRASWRKNPSRAQRLHEIAVHHRTEIQGFRDLDGDLFAVARDHRDRLDVFGSDASGSINPSAARIWRLEARHARISSQDELGFDDAAPQHRSSVAASLQPQWRLANARLLLTLGVRLEQHWQRWHAVDAISGVSGDDELRDRFGSRTFQGGVRWSLGTDVWIKANLGAYERIPTLLELFGDRGTTQGNPELVAESGTNRDLGIVFSRPEQGRRFALSFFMNDARDLITFRPTSPATARAENLARADIDGVEVEADFGRFGPWSFTAAVTRLRTRDRSDDVTTRDRQLPGRPGYEIEIRPGAHLGRLDMGLSIFALGSNFADKAERVRIPDRVLFGIDGRWQLDASWSLRARIDNLGDEEVFDLWGYPLPGRRATLSLQAGLPNAH